MRKFIIVGETIMNIDRIGAVYIVDNLTVDRHISDLTGAYSVQFEIDCGANTHYTYMTGYQTREAANEFLTKMFDTLNGNKEKEAENSGKPEPVLFEKWQDQWVKAKLVYKDSRIRAIKEDEVYMIKPYIGEWDRKCVAIRDCSSQKERRYHWKDFQFVLVGQKKGEDYE